MNGLVGYRQQYEIERASYQGYGVEQAALETDTSGPKNSHSQNEYQDKVLYALGLAVLIKVDFLCRCFFAVGDEADEMVQRAKRTDPAAEEAAENDC